MTAFPVVLKRSVDYYAVSSRVHENVRLPLLDPVEEVAARTSSPEREMEIPEYPDEFQ